MPSDLFSDESSDQIRTVSQLTAEIKDLLETTFPAVWVRRKVTHSEEPSLWFAHFSMPFAAQGLPHLAQF